LSKRVEELNTIAAKNPTISEAQGSTLPTDPVIATSPASRALHILPQLYLFVKSFEGEINGSRIIMEMPEVVPEIIVQATTLLQLWIDCTSVATLAALNASQLTKSIKVPATMNVILDG